MGHRSRCSAYFPRDTRPARAAVLAAKQVRSGGGRNRAGDAADDLLRPGHRAAHHDRAREVDDRIRRLSGRPRRHRVERAQRTHARRRDGRAAADHGPHRLTADARPDVFEPRSGRRRAGQLRGARAPTLQRLAPVRAGARRHRQPLRDVAHRFDLEVARRRQLERARFRRRRRLPRSARSRAAPGELLQRQRARHARGHLPPRHRAADSTALPLRAAGALREPDHLRQLVRHQRRRGALGRHRSRDHRPRPEHAQPPKRRLGPRRAGQGLWASKRLRQHAARRDAGAVVDRSRRCRRARPAVFSAAHRHLLDAHAVSLPPKVGSCMSTPRGGCKPRCSTPCIADRETIAAASRWWSPAW